METDDQIAFDHVLRKLGGTNGLSQGDRQAILDLPFRTANVSACHFLMREGDTAEECCILLSGYACRHKMTAEGGRQIVSFHMTGDLLDLQHIWLERADHNIQTITPARIAWVEVAAMRALVLERPALARAMWRDTLIDASIVREWVLNIGRRDSQTRLAHMLCEFATRRSAAGLGDPERFDLPMSQEQIADATGMTPVHVNRMLQKLADDGVIARNRRAVEIIDWPRMQEAADFDPLYLHEAA